MEGAPDMYPTNPEKNLRELHTLPSFVMAQEQNSGHKEVLQKNNII